MMYETMHTIYLSVLGLDPAQPCFQADDPDIRLDPSDADFIDVIHTNGRVLLKVGLGLPQPIGEMIPFTPCPQSTNYVTGKN
jgi:hypothetical protein